ncbi:MAG: cytochrome c oxidase assembly protein [Gammaproteobacteria bacterium]|nr:MAG: cytochrome c oxidase assembly protein [Gammaproteobacteria bacterium]
MKEARGNRLLVGKLVLLTLGMFAFGYALVPLYDVFCEVTGIGDRTGSPTAATYLPTAADTDRVVEIEFIASVNQGAPWEFRPAVSRMQVHPGKMYQTTFFARNTAGEDLVGQAVPSVAPGLANRYFQKTECFCFTEQRFEAGEGRDMPVVFFIDPELPDHLETVTLSYTFFAQDRVAAR